MLNNISRKAKELINKKSNEINTANKKGVETIYVSLK